MNMKKVTKIKNIERRGRELTLNQLAVITGGRLADTDTLNSDGNQDTLHGDA
jgi:hypothetical protein